MITRRTFLGRTAASAASLLVTPLWNTVKPAGELKISLAEWSLHRTIRSGKLDHLDFARTAIEKYQIDAVEYVNGLFGTKTMDFKQAAKNNRYLTDLLTRSKDAGVVNHLLMVDEEGDLAGVVGKNRLAAVDNHKKWIEAAKFLGCSTVRVNLHGKGDSDMKKVASVDSLSRLGEFAQPMNINIVVENHGGDSSKGNWIAAIMSTVNRSNVGTLPDFGNFCISHPWGTTQEPCTTAYDRYQGVQEMLPFAKGLSAKTYDFDNNGDQPKIDYRKMMQIVKSSEFSGYIGIEYEGFTQSEDEGIRKTKQLLEKLI